MTAKSGYAQKARVGDGTPRTPKPGNGSVGPSPTAKRAQDGTRQNAVGKK